MLFVGWNGIALALVDIAKQHTTKKTHADVGMRVADYPTIQDYVGEAIIDTNSARAFVFMLAKAMDDATNNCDWSIHKDSDGFCRARRICTGGGRSSSPPPRTSPMSPTRCCTLAAAPATSRHSASSATCATARPAGSWARPTRCCASSSASSRFWAIESLDYWNKSINERMLNNEIKKMDRDQKRQLAEKLLKDLAGIAA